MEIKTLEQRLHEKAVAELKEEIKKAFAQIDEFHRWIESGRIRFEGSANGVQIITSGEKPVVWIDRSTLRRAYMDDIEVQLAPMRQQRAVKEFLEKFEELQDKVWDLENRVP